jgi:hypothetical protein
MKDAKAERVLREKYAGLAAVLDERSRRLWAATEAKAYGRGGQSLLAQVTGLSRTTIQRGLHELAERVKPEAGLIRRVGGGRKPITYQQPGLLAALANLVEPTSRGDPESPLRWSCKSVRHLADALQKQGYRIGRQKVADLLSELGYSLQANCKTKEGSTHPDRNAQFDYINTQVQAFQRRCQPVVSVDTKKKELVGDFYNGGSEWQPHQQPEPVRVHDFVDKQLGQAIPYGVYDLTANQSWVSVGIDHDTAEFAVESIRRWWQQMGRLRYQPVSELLITADGGGSNSSRSRLWKVALQRLVDEVRWPISVCHFPPGTSKWNKIEHRMFSQIAINWRGRPLTTHEVIVNLIRSTTTQQGLLIHAQLDPNLYPTGIVVTDYELACVNLQQADFHGEWNYTILPSATNF